VGGTYCVLPARPHRGTDETQESARQPAGETLVRAFVGALEIERTRASTKYGSPEILGVALPPWICMGLRTRHHRGRQTHACAWDAPGPLRIGQSGHMVGDCRLAWMMTAMRVSLARRQLVVEPPGPEHHTVRGVGRPPRRQHASAEGKGRGLEPPFSNPSHLVVEAHGSPSGRPMRQSSGTHQPRASS